MKPLSVRVKSIPRYDALELTNLPKFLGSPKRAVAVLWALETALDGGSARHEKTFIHPPYPWHCSFRLLWDSVVVDRKSLELALINAGQLVGLADGRGSIGYGRFEVQKLLVLS